MEPSHFSHIHGPRGQKKPEGSLHFADGETEAQREWPPRNWQAQLTLPDSPHFSVSPSVKWVSQSRPSAPPGLQDGRWLSRWRWLCPRGCDRSVSPPPPAQLARDNFFHCGVLYEDSLSSQVHTRMELEEDVKIYLDENYERINVPVPRFGGGDPADIIHDFQRVRPSRDWSKGGGCCPGDLGPPPLRAMRKKRSERHGSLHTVSLTVNCVVGAHGLGLPGF